MHLVLQIPPHRPVTVEELIDNIERETWAIGTATGRRVIENFARWKLVKFNGQKVSDFNEFLEVKEDFEVLLTFIS